MEDMGLKQPMTPGFWQGKRVFLTGHTGFKGSWLSLWLESLGAHVKGYALDPPTVPALFTVARVAEGIESEIADIRDLATLSASMSACKPDIVIHMAAQPLVRLSYREPIETYATNVMGTANVLESTRRSGSVRCIVCVTSDKCYENQEYHRGYSEEDRMGGHDPYSSSKGCAELVISAYRRSFFGANGGPALASVRAGNVIGGGDWAADRLIPDVLRSFEEAAPVAIRNPQAIRPWQHVLEPLSGYLTLTEALWHSGQAYAEGWNFGPSDEDAWPVKQVVECMVQRWGEEARWELDGQGHPHEASLLKLDCSKARARLNWAPRWELGVALARTVEWHRDWLQNKDMRTASLQQIADYAATPDRIPA
jgi:CDP-glucose 4,6-dehydratase